MSKINTINSSNENLYNSNTKTIPEQNVEEPVFSSRRNKYHIYIFIATPIQMVIFLINMLHLYFYSDTNTNGDFPY